MALGIRAQSAPLLLNRALSRQLLVYATLLLLTAAVALVSMGVDANAWPVTRVALLFGIPSVLLVVLMFWLPHPLIAALYLLSAGGALFLSATAVLTYIPNAATTALAPFALVSIAMTLTSGVATRIQGRLAWAIGGFVLSTLSLWAAATAGQGEFRLDARAVIGALVIVGIAFIVPGQVTLATKAQEAFDVSVAEIEADGERASVGREAVARLHDTLLADLTVVTKIKPGPLSKQMRETLEMELAHLVSTDWLVAAIERSDAARRENDLTSEVAEGFMAVIDSYLLKGLTVNVSGEISALSKLSPESVSALEGAFGQCLSNVIAHAGILNVDVVVLESGDGVTLTVIDGGFGFDPDAVAVNRLGLRVSVRSRIENAGGFVKIWSIPGQGTAIMLQLPYGGRA